MRIPFALGVLSLSSCAQDLAAWPDAEPHPLADRASIVEAWSAASIPLQVFLAVAGTRGCEDSDCPSVTHEGTTTVVEGGCSEDGRTWHGTQFIEKEPGIERYEYEAWGFTEEETGAWIEADGVQVLRQEEESAVLESDLDVDFEGALPGWLEDEVVAASFRAHRIELEETGGTWSIEGAVLLPDEGALEMHGSGELAGREPIDEAGRIAATTGDASLHGAQDVTIELEGPGACIRYEADDGTAGETCR